MIPQEKAKELVNKYLQVYDGRLPIAKQCALIAVDEAEKSECNVLKNFEFVSQKYTSAYWTKVKQEIENL